MADLTGNFENQDGGKQGRTLGLFISVVSLPCTKSLKNTCPRRLYRAIKKTTLVLYLGLLLHLLMDTSWNTKVYIV